MKKEKSKKSSPVRYAGLGIDLVVNTLVGGAIGYLLDRWLGTSPWLLIVFLILGAAAGFLTVFKMIERGDKDS